MALDRIHHGSHNKYLQYFMNVFLVSKLRFESPPHAAHRKPIYVPLNATNSRWQYTSKINLGATENNKSGRHHFADILSATYLFQEFRQIVCGLLQAGGLLVLVCSQI